MWTVAQLAADLAAGRTSSRRLTEQALERIADPAGEGARAFIKVYADSALAEADFSDRLRKHGVRRSPVDGLPVSLKDLFDVAGDVTRAGSKVLNRKAETDAPAPARRRRGVRGPHQYGGVRLRHHRHQPALRHAEKSVGPRHWQGAGGIFLR